MVIKYFTRKFSYIQGQYREKTREYFYFIDHQGMLFMDDARIKNFTSCFKDKKFLSFFFTRVKENRTGYYETIFPFVSPCGREMNYIRCDDLPTVFTRIDKNNNNLIWAHVEELTVPFEPPKIYMSESGRIYHPTPKFPHVGLIASKIAIEICNNFTFDCNGTPEEFTWQGQNYSLTNECKEILNNYHKNVKIGT